MLDLRLHGATVYPVSGREVAHEIGIWRGRVVGVDEQIRGLPAKQEVNLDGATILPGFVDPHVHMVWAGLKERTWSIAHCTTVDQALAVIDDARAEAEWLDVVGYDQRRLGRHITARELDTVARGRKVLLLHDSGHACVVSSSVLAELDHPHEDGFLAEGGMAAVRALRQPYSLDEMSEAINTAALTCLKEGVTTVAEAGVGGGLISHSPIEIAAYQRAEVPMRIQFMVAGSLLRDRHAHRTDDVPRAMDLGVYTGFGGDRFGIGALKIFTDGGMMARTAALTEPYAGEDHNGQLYADPAELTALIVDGHRAGWQLAIHAIGDRAVDLALDALTEAQRLFPRPACRHRIEHAGAVRPDQLARFAALDLTAVVQPNFLYYNGDDYAAIMGPDRAPWLYRARSFLDHGVKLVGSSDRPVTNGAPLRAIQFMVTRETEQGTSLTPEEAITVPEALRAFTIDAAYACNLESSVGSLAEGKLADMVVLADDPHTVDPGRIGDIEVIATVFGGEIAYGDEYW
ncbi:amidohydrolase [Actinokineospora inagensis]|uniref:amidohydrolase n=1 Tax=Actinokineospora inagensis TaxID=103730 RepID=UPI0003FB4F1B|nr:amidohydrolase [Actinokineospora inagensis]